MHLLMTNHILLTHKLTCGSHILLPHKTAGLLRDHFSLRDVSQAQPIKL